MSTPFHILIDRQNMVGWLTACAYLHENTANPDYLECSGQAASMESHPFRMQWSPAFSLVCEVVGPKEAQGKKVVEARAGGREVKT